MKIKKTKRLLALILCMALVLGTNTFTMAAGAGQTQEESLQEQENISQEEILQEPEENSPEEAGTEAVQAQALETEEIIEEEPQEEAQEQPQGEEIQKDSMGETEEATTEDDGQGETAEMIGEENVTEEAAAGETESEKATEDKAETTVPEDGTAESEQGSENTAQDNDQGKDSQTAEAGEKQENGESSGDETAGNTVETPQTEENAADPQALDSAERSRQSFTNTVNQIAQILYGRWANYEDINSRDVKQKYEKLTDYDKEQIQQLVSKAEAEYDNLGGHEQITVSNINSKLELVKEVVQNTSDIIDADEKPVSQEDYNSMLEAMKTKLDTATETNVPIKDWRRSETTTTVNKPTEHMDWQWEDVADTLSLPVYQDESKVWDGSRLNSEGKVDHQASKEENGGYLRNNQITATGGTLYDSATWEVGDRRNDNQATLYRFQGKVHINEVGDVRAQYAYTLQQVTGGNEIYVNDDIFVFIYPEGTQITNRNFMQYLAFWAGTSNQDGITDFNGREGAAVSQENSYMPSLTGLTDGWHTTATTNNAAVITDNPNETDFVVDVFTDDYAACGGVYRLQLTKEKVPMTSIKFVKVDENNEEQGLEGADFTLTKSDNSVSSTATSDENGNVTFNVPIPDGSATYTLKESSAPEGYEKLDTKWTVTVQRDGKYTIRNGYQALETRDSDGAYIIKNKSNWNGTLTFTKTASDLETPVNGAEFVLENGDGEEIARGTSNNSGTVTIDNIKAGTYTMYEKSVPEPYMVSNETWTVVADPVAKDVRIYASSDTEQTTPIDKIANYTSGEEAVKNLEKSKTVTVTDEGKREYRIDLTASTTGSIVTPGEAAKIVLVLDGSGSMNDILSYYTRERRDEAVRDAVYDFVIEIAKISPESEVGITVYQASKNQSQSKLLNLTPVNALVQKNGDTYVQNDTLSRVMNNYVNMVTDYSGGTYPSRGLNAAANMLSETTKQQNHTIILCDGDSNDSYWNLNSALSSVKNVSTLHAIGFALGKSDSGTFEDIKSWVSGSGKAYEADDKDQLIEAFRNLLKDDISPQELTATVVDVIDNRFTITKAEEERLEKEGATVERNEETGQITVTWPDTTIGGKDGDNPGWEQYINIKAKDDFIGGNLIPTNDDGSGIQVDTNTFVDFPKPTVNVPLLDLKVSGGEETVFLGDTITVNDDIIKKLLNTLTFEDGTKIPGIEADEITFQLSSDGQSYTASIPEYKYPNTEDTIGSFTFTFTPVKGSLEDHVAETVGDDAEIYQLKVEYTAKTLEERKTIIGYDTEKYHEPVGTELTGNELKREADGEYIINVVAGSIEITKAITNKGNSAIEGDPIFTFKIEYSPVDGGEGKVYYRTIRFSDNESEKTAELLSNLPKGDYKVTELTTQKYEFDGISGTEDSTCSVKTESGSKSVTFHIGQKAGNINALDAKEGVVTYTNKKTGPSTNTSTDTIVNRYEYKDGEWTVSQIQVPGEGQEEKPVTSGGEN